MKTLKEIVANNAKVHFQFYRKNELWYITDCGFEFPVPISDTGDGTFLAEDKAMLFMRYIRKQLEAINEAVAEGVREAMKQIDEDMARREVTNELLEKTYSI